MAWDPAQVVVTFLYTVPGTSCCLTHILQSLQYFSTFMDNFKVIVGHDLLYCRALDENINNTLVSACSM